MNTIHFFSINYATCYRVVEKRSENVGQVAVGVIKNYEQSSLQFTIFQTSYPSTSTLLDESIQHDSPIFSNPREDFITVKGKSTGIISLHFSSASECKILFDFLTRTKTQMQSIFAQISFRISDTCLIPIHLIKPGKKQTAVIPGDYVGVALTISRWNLDSLTKGDVIEVFDDSTYDEGQKNLYTFTMDKDESFAALEYCLLGMKRNEQSECLIPVCILHGRGISSTLDTYIHSTSDYCVHMNFTVKGIKKSKEWKKADISDQLAFANQKKQDLLSQLTETYKQWKSQLNELDISRITFASKESLIRQKFWDMHTFVLPVVQDPAVQNTIVTTLAKIEHQLDRIKDKSDSHSQSIFHHLRDDLSAIVAENNNLESTLESLQEDTEIQRQSLQSLRLDLGRIRVKQVEQPELVIESEEGPEEKNERLKKELSDLHHQFELLKEETDITQEETTMRLEKNRLLADHDERRKKRAIDVRMEEFEAEMRRRAANEKADVAKHVIVEFHSALNDLTGQAKQTFNFDEEEDDETKDEVFPFDEELRTVIEESFSTARSAPPSTKEEVDDILEHFTDQLDMLKDSLTEKGSEVVARHWKQHSQFMKEYLSVQRWTKTELMKGVSEGSGKIEKKVEEERRRVLEEIEEEEKERTEADRLATTDEDSEFVALSARPVTVQPKMTQSTKRPDEGDGDDGSSEDESDEHEKDGLQEDNEGDIPFPDFVIKMLESAGIEPGPRVRADDAGRREDEEREEEARTENETRINDIHDDLETDIDHHHKEREDESDTPVITLLNASGLELEGIIESPVPEFTESMMESQPPTPLPKDAEEEEESEKNEHDRKDGSGQKTGHGENGDDESADESSDDSSHQAKPKVANSAFLAQLNNLIRGGPQKSFGMPRKSQNEGEEEKKEVNENNGSSGYVFEKELTPERKQERKLPTRMRRRKGGLASVAEVGNIVKEDEG
ncbi:hypothetical protein BLNAU_8009 [Blattamonas nauphoetae]|uniref:Uncharacterized protein n=1 Tax=Blattamonas nauphoetae TaxID=2049346 RepID=A0ABQ9XZR9_9EUKA|nr:hypothetical protein BLNAU_8009 [Blattamonas nauphoetae]